MTLSALGIFSAAGAGGGPAAAPAYELISTTILGSTQSELTFSNLGDWSSTYKHLQIRATIRSGKVAGDVPLLIRFNGITSNSYLYHILYGTNTTAANYSGGSPDNGIYLGNPIPGTSATASAFAGVVIDVLDSYSTTKNKTIRALYGGTSPNAVQFASGGFFSTASVSSITIYPDSGGWVSGSRFSIYGIKG
jgi:hypothetical protein